MSIARSPSTSTDDAERYLIWKTKVGVLITGDCLDDDQCFMDSKIPEVGIGPDTQYTGSNGKVVALIVHWTVKAT